MLAAIGGWIERRRADARAPVAINAYFEAQRRATCARLRDDRAEFYHWVKVAADVARIEPLTKMDIDAVRAVVAEEERHPN